MPERDIERIQLLDLSFVLLYSEEVIRQRVGELGEVLSQRYGTTCPLFLSVLSGAFVFAADLIRAFRGPCEVSFVQLRSYSGTQSIGAVQTVMGVEGSLQGRHVVVVEDIVDTGRTLHFLQNYLRERQAASICTVALLRKPAAVVFPVTVDFVGFDIADRFVVGYGLDYNGLGRNLSGIYQREEAP